MEMAGFVSSSSPVKTWGVSASWPLCVFVDLSLYEPHPSSRLPLGHQIWITLHSGLQPLKLKKGDKIVFPFFSFRLLWQSQLSSLSAQLPLSSVSLLTETVWPVFIAWWCWFKSSLWPLKYTHYEAGAKCQSHFLHCLIVLLSQNRDDTEDVDPYEGVF